MLLIEEVWSVFTLKLSGDTELKLLQLQNADELYTLVDHNREHLRAWLPWVDKTLYVSDIEVFINRSICQYAEEGTITAGIFDRGSLVGVISLTVRDPERREIGYWLDKAHQGRGIMTTACKALIDYAFSNTTAQRIDIRVEPANGRSRSIPERLGFTCESVFNEPVLHANELGRVLVTYVMLKSEWLRSRAI